MQPARRGFLWSLAAAVAGAVLSGAAAVVLVSLHPPGTEEVHPALWGVAVLPVAASLVLAGALADGARGVLLNALAFLLPQAVAVLVVFFLFVHPGGGPALVLVTLEFWSKVAAVYALLAAVVGVESLLFRWARR